MSEQECTKNERLTEHCLELEDKKAVTGQSAAKHNFANTAGI
jgi:hypothetical protein